MKLSRVLGFSFGFVSVPPSTVILLPSLLMHIGCGHGLAVFCMGIDVFMVTSVNVLSSTPFVIIFLIGFSFHILHSFLFSGQDFLWLEL